MHEKKEKKTLECCPHCGSTYGFYRCVSFSGNGRFSYNWDGSHGNDEDLHDGVRYKERKTAHCYECHKVIKLPFELPTE